MTPDPSGNRNWRLAVVGIGLVALMAQTWLFRELLTVFDGNELTVGIFLASWLFWLALGAACGVRWFRRWRPGYGMLVVLLPVLAGQLILFQHLREWAGLPYFAALPVGTLVGLTWLANAPTALIAGALFTLAVGWRDKTAGPVVGNAYVVEAIGSMIGALVITAGFLLLTGRDCPWPGAAAQWQRQLPGGCYDGSWMTAQAVYSYGEYQGSRLVISGGTTIECLPDREDSQRAAVAALAQQPKPGRVLLIGTGETALVQELTGLPEVREVVWLAPDPEYPAAALSRLAGDWHPPAGKLTVPGVDITAYLRNHKEKFDLVLVRLTAPVSLAATRWFSADFYAQLRQRLNSDGILGVGFPGGENFIGPELAMIGATLLNTLERQFPAVVLQSGETACFWCGDQGRVTLDLRQLRQRLESTSLGREGRSGWLALLYDRFRTGFQMAAYRRAQTADAAVWQWQDRRCPALFLYSMLFYWKKNGGINMTGAIMKNLTTIRKGILGVGTAAFGLGLAGLLGVGASGRGRRVGRWLLVAMAAATVMALDILSLLRFQFDHGSIFLYFGLANAVFMAGLAWGGYEAVKRSWSRRALGWTTAGLALLAGILLVTAGQTWPLWVYGIEFGLLGVAGGVWVPIVAGWRERDGDEKTTVAGQLVAADNWGGMCGALLPPLVLLPLVFETGTLGLILAALVWLGVALLVWSDHRKLVLGGCAVLVLAAIPVRGADWSLSDRQLTQFKIDRGGLTAVTATTTDGKNVMYYRVGTAAAPGGYLFRTSDLVVGPKGYQAPIALLAYVGGAGKLRGFTVIASQETPKFLARVMMHREELKNQDIFQGKAAFQGEAVTGATYSSRAIAATLNAAGQRFQQLLQEKATTAGADKNSVGNSGEPPPGGPRKIDANLYRKLISEDKLSDHPASNATPVKNP